MTTNTTTTKTYWDDLNGRICCPDHLGYSASAALQANPTTRVIETDLTVWTRMTDDDIAEWSDYLATVHFETEVCESCRFEGK